MKKIRRVRKTKRAEGRKESTSTLRVRRGINKDYYLQNHNIEAKKKDNQIMK
jgi:hypothetical protein